MIHLHGIVVTFFLLAIESLSAEESTRWVYIAKTEVMKTLFSTRSHIKNIVFNMKSYHNRRLFRTFPLLPCIQCSSLSKKQGEAMMVIEPILILANLCWCTIHCDFNHSDMQRVLPISNSFLRLFGIRWLHYLERPCNSNHHYNCSLYITDILIAFLSPPAVTNYC